MASVPILRNKQARSFFFVRYSSQSCCGCEKRPLLRVPAVPHEPNRSSICKEVYADINPLKAYFNRRIPV
jgi:hypothetical protein